MRNVANGTHVVVKASKTAQKFESPAEGLYRIAFTVAQGEENSMYAVADNYAKLDDSSEYTVMSVGDWNTLDGGNGNAFLEPTKN